MKYLKLIFITLSFFVFLSCTKTSSEPECICTQEFRFSTVFIADNNLNGIDSLLTESKNKLSGEKYQLYQDDFWGKGNYIVMDDSYTIKFSQVPTQVVFSAKKSGIDIEADYFFNTDECKCHINKVSGPDTIIVR